MALGEGKKEKERRRRRRRRDLHEVGGGRVGARRGRTRDLLANALAQALEQLGIGRDAQDAVELGAVVVDEADPVDRDVPHQPAPVEVDHLVIEEDLAAAAPADGGVHHRVIARGGLPEIADGDAALAAVHLGDRGQPVHEPALHEAREDGAEVRPLGRGPCAPLDGPERVLGGSREVEGATDELTDRGEAVGRPLGGRRIGDDLVGLCERRAQRFGRGRSVGLGSAMGDDDQPGERNQGHEG